VGFLARVSLRLNRSGHPQEKKGGRDEYGTSHINSKRATSRSAGRAEKQAHPATTKGGAQEAKGNAREKFGSQEKKHIFAAFLDFAFSIFFLFVKL
jgi:hypothetical protein